MKNLISEPPYVPLSGMNPDGNGISILSSEAPWIENLRPMARGLRTREGFKGLFSFVTPPKFFHTHYLAGSQIGTATLFGFSQRNIWQYSPGTYDYWKPVRTALYVADVFDGAAPNVSYAKTNEAFDQGFFAEFTDTEEGEYTNAVDGEFPLDAAVVYASGNLLLFHFPNVTNPVATLDDASTVALEKHGDFYYLPVPAGRTVSHLSNDEDAFPRGRVWVFAHHFNCTHFSTCEVLDDGGYSLVMAGSTPPEIGKEETDGATRVLWSCTSGTWTTKTISQQWSVGRESTGKVLAVAAVPDATIFDEMTAGDTIIPGSVSFFTLEKGQICKASAILVAGKYKLYSDDGYVDEAASYVNPDGTWSITLTAAGWTYFGALSIYANYSYKTPFAFAPRHVAFFAGRLVFGGTYESSKYFPWRVRYCYSGDSNLAIEYDYSDLLDYGLETLECLKQLGNSLFAYTREGLYRGFTDNAGNLLFQSFWAGGTPCGRTVTVFNNLHFFLGTDDIYVFDGAQVRSITLLEGVSRVKETIFRRIDTEKYQRCFSCFYPKEKEVWFFLKRGGENYPTEAWVYAIDRAIWFLFRFPETVSVGQYAEENFPTWDSLGTLTWDDIQVTWDELGSSSSRRAPVLCTISGPCLISHEISSDSFMKYEYAGPFATEAEALALGESHLVTPDWFAITVPARTQTAWFFITRDFIYQHLERKDRTLLCDFEALGSSVTIGVNGDFALDPISFEQSYSIALGSSYSKLPYHPDFYDYAIRYLFQGTGFFDFRWMQTKAKTFKHKGET